MRIENAEIFEPKKDDFIQVGVPDTSDEIVNQANKVISTEQSEDSSNVTTSDTRTTNAGPIPLMRPIADPEEYPIDAMGEVCGQATAAIARMVQVPTALAANSVLAAASLSIQSQANVKMPFEGNSVKPLQLYLLTVAQSSDRKSSADHVALKGISAREEELYDNYSDELSKYDLGKELYDDSVKTIKKTSTSAEDKSGDLESIQHQIHEQIKALKQPTKPFNPQILIKDPTPEGLQRFFKDGHPSIGFFNSEAGVFTGGYSMSAENKIKTAGNFNAIWDGDPFGRERAGDNSVMHKHKRMSMHLMMQRDIALAFMSDRAMMDIGFFSRTLVTAPVSLAGTRTQQNVCQSDREAAELFNDRIYSNLRLPYPLRDGTTNELSPRILVFSEEAQGVYWDFYMEIERELGINGNYWRLPGLGGKLAEHACRLAGVLTLMQNIQAEQIPAHMMKNGIQLAKYYGSEALRLYEAGMMDPELTQAQLVLDWLHKDWGEEYISSPDLQQVGPNSIRTKKAADMCIEILQEHGWLRKDSGQIINGRKRRNVYRIISHS